MTYSKSDCISSLQEAAELIGKSPTAKEYSNTDLLPSRSAIIQKFGSWNRAKESAELAKRESTHNRKSVDVSYFSNIQTEEQAYWLGFIYGDGCVRTDKNGVLRLQLALAEKDSEQIKQFKNDINSDHQLNYIERGGNTQNQISIVISRRDFVENLVELGADSNKTHSSSLPNLSSKQLQASFVRGLYDADGHKTENSWAITGSSKERFCQLQSWIPVDSNIYSHSTEGCYVISISESNDLSTLKNWLYPNGKNTSPMMDRKFL